MTFEVDIPTLMKKTGFAILLGISILLIGSCKKYEQQQEQNILINLMTNGVWVVTHYSQNGTDITSSFSGYTFQFRSNQTVTGMNGNININGTWTPNIANRTITADFPTAGAPLDNLNAVWTITDSYPDSVAANATIDSSLNILDLKKH